MGPKRVLLLPLRVTSGALFTLALLISTACGSGRQAGPALPDRNPTQPSSYEKAEPTPQAQVPEDPVSSLIARSEEHYVAGERELTHGHLDQARLEFDRAVDVLLESQDGARWDARLREHFDRLIDRINAREVMALAEGDGFTEKKYEQASIDELLDVAMFARPVPELSTREAVEAGLDTHDIPIPLNDRVLSYVELFQGRLREYVQDSLSRGSQYLPMIQSVFRAEGLPLDLAYIPIVESAFKPNALSRAKAKGVWQFMRGTALENGLRHDWYIDERSDPEKATLAAAKYLKTLHAMFDGDWHLALASYNGGPNRVKRALKRFDADDFWALSKRNGSLPRETREYVPMILAAMIVARNPAQYGIEFEPQAPIEYDRVTVPRGVDLRRVAEWTGATIDQIQALNPELRRWTTPVRYEYDVKVPSGTADQFRDRLASTPAAELTAVKHYTVRRGESIATIARKLKVNRVDLAEANHLSVRSRLRAGQSLIIPRAPATMLAARTDRPAPPAQATTKAANGHATVAQASAPTAGRATTYRVRRGDTLISIARMFNTTVAHIKQWNDLSSNRIIAGDRLTIFASRTR